MKVNNVKSFEYRTDLLGGVDKTTSEVNNFIQNLKKERHYRDRTRYNNNRQRNRLYINLVDKMKLKAKELLKGERSGQYIT